MPSASSLEKQKMWEELKSNPVDTLVQTIQGISLDRIDK
jgi:hypothetical protein